jgi:CRP/FNR family cyclic AMP-dependent transcriptional regulator
MSGIDFLKRVPIFAKLSEAELKVLVGSLRRKNFAKGETIFHQGSPGYSLYIIESGRVRIYTLSMAGREISVTIYSSGDVIGELAILDELPRSAWAVAMEPTRTLLLHRDDFLRHARDYPEMALNIMAVLSAKLRYTTEYAESLACLDVYGRVAKKLLEMTRQHGVEREEAKVEVRLTQAELASLVGSTREWVNKVLRAYQEQGLIELGRQRITVLDAEGLRERIESF